MATKVSDILARVQALGYGTDTEAAQILTLNSLHKRVVNTRRWSFLLTVDTSKATVVGDGTYALTTLPETKRVDAVRLENASSKLLLEHQEVSLVRDFEHMYRENGTPEYWTMVGTELHIWPIPDEVYTIVLDLVEKPKELTTAANEIQIPDASADILVWGTIMGVTFRERDWDGHNFARQMYAELLAELLAQYGMTDRQTSKHVVSSGFHDQFDIESSWLS